MTIPKLDSRTINDILAEIKKKSEFYTPEWRFDFENPDAGAALAQLFAEMFYDTIDRYNRFPDKCYLEFLNMLGVSARSVTPAVGMADITLVDNVEENVFVKKGTQLFKDMSDDDGEFRVVFETDSGVFATPAEITALYMTDPIRDIITRTDISDPNSMPIELFHAKESENIERHRFAISNDAVLRLKNSAEIVVRTENSGMLFRKEAYIERLTDPNQSSWSFFDGERFIPLSVQKKDGDILLTKSDRAEIAFTDEYCKLSEDESGHPWIFCDMKASDGAEELTVDSLMVNSRSITDPETGRGINPDHIFFNDTEISTTAGGYCFGQDPNIYDSFYICCSEAFSKGLAEVSVEMFINTVIMGNSEIPEDENIEFNRRLLVDKADSQIRPFDDIYISDVIWEYWNGFGWALLEVSGDINPFSCLEEPGKRVVSFRCPADMESLMQNAYSGLWIRARIRTMENRYSLRARMLLPHVKNIDIRYDYGMKFLPAERVAVSNNCVNHLYEPRGSKMDMTLFRTLPEKHHAVYLLFDKEPSGYPINLYFDFSGTTGEERVLTFEYLAGDRSGRSYWSELKTVDKTNGFENSGIISLYTPKGFCEASLFGETGYWIRAVNRSMQFNPKCEKFPRLNRIIKNTVDITQKETIKDEQLEFRAGVINQRFALRNHPIIDCELWVNELNETPFSELQRLEELDPRSVNKVLDDAGQVAEFWVKWSPKATLAESDGDERHYALEYTNGIISFGDGINGKVPSYNSTLELSVNYTFGGGKRGNLGIGEIDGLVVGIPFVTDVTNVVPTCGGSDEQSLDTIRKIGTKRLRHRGRAVTAEDFENIILEEFCEVSEVCCYNNRNADGKQESGAVTVVVMPHDFENASYSLMLCKKIRSFLEGCTSCELLCGKRLSVIPAIPMTVNSEITVQIDDYEYAAETERRIIAAVTALLTGSKGRRIGVMPTVSDIITTLRRLEHISFISRVVLEGEYYRDNERITVPLDENVEYRYLVAANGTHTVKL